MPRKVILLHPPKSRDLQNLVYPLSVFGRCESAAHVREGLRDAKEQKFIPDEEILHYGESLQRSPDKLRAIDTETDRNQAALSAAYSLSQARILFKQAEVVPESVQPILYYYGGLSLMEFLTTCVVRRERVGSPGHGLSVSCDSEGWDFDSDWPRGRCRVKMGSTGDFPFFIDALTVGGWPSLFSGYGLYRDSDQAPWQINKNPAPLLTNKMSLDLLCNFDYKVYGDDHPDPVRWPRNPLMMTEFLMDFVILFVASSLARYYKPAWRAIVDATKSPIYNDIRAAYNNISQGLPEFFADQRVFQISLGTHIWLRL
jgi:hypothetical protein